MMMNGGVPNNNNNHHDHQQQSRETILRVGMVGGGTVGGGVYEILMGAMHAAPHHQQHNVHHHPHHNISSAAAGGRRRLPRGVICIISKLCVLNIKKQRNFNIDYQLTTLTTNVDDIIHDRELDIIIEVMGNDNDNNNNTETSSSLALARRVVLESLRNGKIVITANKALVSKYYDEIQKTLWENIHKGARLGIEATVCGGVPIIHTLQSCYTGDVIYQIMGMCNSTANQLLARMESTGKEFHSVLKEAQQLEQGGDRENSTNGEESDCDSSYIDWTQDINHSLRESIEGHDVRDQMIILSKLAFEDNNHHIQNNNNNNNNSPSTIPCQGISNITSADIEYSRILNCKIKFVGIVQRTHLYGEYDGPVSIYVSPMMISTSHILSKIMSHGDSQNNNNNQANGIGIGAGACASSSTSNNVIFYDDDDDNAIITITSSNLGTCIYSGPGSGRYPTAHSIVNDLARLVVNRNNIAAVTEQFSSTFSHGITQQQNATTAQNDHNQQQEQNNNNNNGGQQQQNNYYNDYTSCFYVRIPYMDSVGIISRVGTIAEHHNVSIYSILQNPILNRHNANFCITTDECRLSQINDFCYELQNEHFCIGEPLAMPMIS